MNKIEINSLLWCLNSKQLKLQTKSYVHCNLHHQKIAFKPKRNGGDVGEQFKLDQGLDNALQVNMFKETWELKGQASAIASNEDMNL